MGNICSSSKAAQTVDTAVDKAAENKDKIVAGVKTAGSKAGLDQAKVDSAAKTVDQALSDKEGLKQKLSSALGGESGKAAAAAEAAPAAATEAAPAAAAVEAAPAAAAEAKA
ncbi:hypothetical protein C2E21_0076 [Chlorella sorokiniana]|uniref:Uncharacterized protein n=1 Tax=Chlorella sorokiniana TaxID=3076 RepID=A0A2P6U3Z5_CHLSO|nr:hypothetical protein C2E21_0076 [Chlorella sorokiniana]|eukprot:PRW61023.1 hypothetical protein C2E21_0076 [Chlorella sorokiniana]